MRRKNTLQPARVLVVDSHRAMRHATVRWVKDGAGLRVCGQAGTRGYAFRCLSRQRPTLVITDLIPPRDWSFLQELRRRYPGLRIILFSACEPPGGARVKALGANGYVCKSDGPQKLLAKVRRLSARQQ
jgi:two-component system, NarL family, invasion response regulator UvrY